jgi:hypothetical protein
LRAWFDRLVERRGYSDRAFGLTGGQFFPSNVRQYLQQLDEQEADIFPERRFYPY